MVASVSVGHITFIPPSQENAVLLEKVQQKVTQMVKVWGFHTRRN